ncbi:MAG: glycosyltransferase family 39 protein, partial [Desulfatiglandales bacterium]
MNTRNGITTKYIPVLILTSALLILFVYHAPWDLDKRDQARQGLYINDLYYNGNFVIQYHRSQTIETKPPLYNWLAYPFSVLYGETNRWVISLPSILATFGVLLLIFFIGKDIGGEARIGFMAAVILLSNSFFLSLSRVARTDMLLTFFITLTLFFFIKGYRNQGKRSLWYYGCYAIMGLGTLTKGPVALILPVGSIFFYLLVKKDLRHIMKAKLPTGIALYVLIIASWVIPAWKMGGREVYEVMFLLENVQKFFGTGERAGRVQPFYFFLTQFLNKFKPWWIFMPFAFSRLKELSKKDRTDCIFLITWFATMLVILSISRTKRPDHLLPLMPAASLIVAMVIDRFAVVMHERRFVKVFGCVNLIYGLLFMIISFIMGLILVFPKTLEALLRSSIHFDRNLESSYLTMIIDNSLLFLFFSLILVALVLLVRRYILRKKGIHAFITFCLMMYLLSIIYLYLFTPTAITNRGSSLYLFSKQAKRFIVEDIPLYFRNCPDSVVFFFGENSPNITESEMIQLMRGDKPFYIVVGSTRNELEGGVGKDLTILEGREIHDK